MTLRERAGRTLVTGGAGFIGGEMVASLLSDGEDVTVIDDLSTPAPDWASRFGTQRRLTFVQGDAGDPASVDGVMAGQDRVIHLASSTDIAGGYGHPDRDFAAGVMATEVVCEAMARHAVRQLWFASSGVVYGRPQKVPTAEGDGPLFPESHYAAAKLAAEALISGFAHLYDWRALAFRFGNTVGGRSDHGVVHDFVVKLLRDPTQLEILGDGNQAKPYIDVTDLVGAIRHVGATPLSRPMAVLNVGPSGTVTVRQVALIVVDALGLATSEVEFRFTADAGSGVAGWRGDTAQIEFDTTALDRLGWRPAIAPADAVRAAALAIASRYRSTGAPLLTTAERRAVARERVAALHA